MIAAKGGAILGSSQIKVRSILAIAPHREAMIGRIAEILGLEPGRVSVKATTTEGMGFTGRGEGIAAQAAASVHFPFDATDTQSLSE